MIARSHRFRGRVSLRRVYREGRSVRGPWFAIKSASNSQRKDYRAAVVVSRKVHKSAVVRNRLRRKLYEAFRALEKDIVDPYDIILTVFNTDLLESSQEALQQKLKKQFQEAGIIARRISK